MRKAYTEDSLTRALDHHVSTKAIGFYRRAPEKLHSWLVELPALGVVTYTTAQLYGLTCGLAASERRWKDRGDTRGLEAFCERQLYRGSLQEFNDQRLA